MLSPAPQQLSISLPLRFAFRSAFRSQLLPAPQRYFAQQPSLSFIRRALCAFGMASSVSGIMAPLGFSSSFPRNCFPIQLHRRMVRACSSFGGVFPCARPATRLEVSRRRTSFYHVIPFLMCLFVPWWGLPVLQDQPPGLRCRDVEPHSIPSSPSSCAF
jgi:hypothetical protein